jgi:hypothetical protein
MATLIPKYDQGSTGASNRPINEKLAETVSVKDFGATGDSTTDDTAAFNACLAACRSDGRTMYIPNGTYKITSPLTVGAPINILGEGVGVSTLAPTFSSVGYLFEFNSAANGKVIENFTVTGPANYDANTNFLKSSAGYIMRFENLVLNNLGQCFYLDLGFSTYLKSIRITYCASPIYIEEANGSHLQDIYIQRYTGVGIHLVASLSSSLESIILEYGDAGTGIQLQACQNTSINQYYTEGGDSTDILLMFKNQRACINTTVSNCWFNSGATKIIWAKSYRGLTIDNVVLQTPIAASLIDFTDINFSDGPIYVGYVCQVDQNANGFIGDVRGTGQTLIPLSTSNAGIVVTKPFPKVGDGTNADLTNIANYTQPDANGRLPVLYIPAMDAKANVVGGFTATSSVTVDAFGSESSGITLNADSYGLVSIRLIGTITASSGAAVFSNFRLTNSTYVNALERGIVSYGASGSAVSADYLVNVQPGLNVITLAITRAQGGGGTNTFTCTNYIIG